MKKMMKSYNIVAVAAAVLLFVVSSGLTKPVNGYFHAGVSSPSGKIAILKSVSQDISDNWKTGFTFGGSVGMSLMTRLEFLVSYDFHSFPIKNLPVETFTGNFITTMYGIGGKINLGVPMTNFNPYLTAGIGRASFSFTVVGQTVSADADTKTYYQFGGGIEFGHFFLQGKYVTISSGVNKRNYLPITIGFKI